ncbi:hypothetical protein AAG906_014232 [Vitis piasezkii]
MEDLDSGHLRCEGYGCKKIFQRVAQGLSHDEPILHEQGSLKLAPHHPKALKIQKTRKRTYIKLGLSSTRLAVVHQIKFMGDLGSGHLRCGKDGNTRVLEKTNDSPVHENLLFIFMRALEGNFFTKTGCKENEKTAAHELAHGKPIFDQQGPCN